MRAEEEERRTETIEPFRERIEDWMIKGNKLDRFCTGQRSRIVKHLNKEYLTYQVDRRMWFRSNDNKLFYKDLEDCVVELSPIGKKPFYFKILNLRQNLWTEFEVQDPKVYEVFLEYFGRILIPQLKPNLQDSITILHEKNSKQKQTHPNNRAMFVQKTQDKHRDYFCKRYQNIKRKDYACPSPSDQAFREIETLCEVEKLQIFLFPKGVLYDKKQTLFLYEIIDYNALDLLLAENDPKSIQSEKFQSQVFPLVGNCMVLINKLRKCGLYYVDMKLQNFLVDMRTSEVWLARAHNVRGGNDEPRTVPRSVDPPFLLRFWKTNIFKAMAAMFEMIYRRPILIHQGQNPGFFRRIVNEVNRQTRGRPGELIKFFNQFFFSKSKGELKESFSTILRQSMMNGAADLTNYCKQSSFIQRQHKKNEYLQSVRQDKNLREKSMQQYQKLYDVQRQNKVAPSSKKLKNWQHSSCTSYYQAHRGNQKRIKENICGFYELTRPFEIEEDDYEPYISQQ